MIGADGDFTLDQLDQQIVAKLRENARITNKAIAADLDVAESTVGARIRSLSDRNVMRIVAMHDVRALGYDLLAHAEVDVAGRDPRQVADELAAIPEITAIALFSGTPQIMLHLLARDRKHLLHLVVEKLGRTAGVDCVRTTISLQVMKFVSEYATFAGEADGAEGDGILDIHDRIIRLIERDARLSNREIARLVGVSETFVRKRLKALAMSGAMRLGAMIDPKALGLSCAAFLQIKVKPIHMQSVASKLVDLSELSFVSLTSGAYDILGVATVRDRMALMEVVNRNVMCLPGIKSVDTKEYVDVVKYRYNYVRIFPKGPE